MRFGTKAAIAAAFAGPAIAALILTGAGTANAAVTTTTAHTTSSGSYFPFCNPFQNQSQFRNQRVQWNVSGSNTVDVTYKGSNFYYPVSFTQFGNCLSGTLTDNGYPTSGPINGTVSGNHVQFSFRYPYGSSQGTRTFVGTIDRWGNVYGYWYETGSEHGHGTWSLTKKVHRACQRYEWWNPNRACTVFPL
ncbi:MAG TPA: hypothetical protein VME19_10200 [Streptosporangiaceae bacterium]|nr:hypothetical protein [Streptosporangiaceae bacterium]